MLLGAFLDAGLELEQLDANMAKLGVSGYELTLEPQTRHGISGSKFDVVDQGSERPVRNLHAVSLNVFQRLAKAESQIHGTTIDEVHFHEVGAVDALVDIVGFCWAIHHLEIEVVYTLLPSPWEAARFEQSTGCFLSLRRPRLPCSP